MRRLIKRLVSGNGHDVFRNMFVLVLGTGAARFVGLLSIPLLTRIYSPEHFGLLSVFVAFVALLLPLSTLLYSVAIPLPRSDRMAMNLLVLCAALVLATAAVSALLLWPFADAILALFSAERLAPYWGLVVLGFAGASAYEVLNNWATRKKAFKAVARTQVTQAIAGNLVKIVLGLLGLKPAGLLLGQIVQQTGGVAFLTRQFWRTFVDHMRFVRARRVLFAFRRYRDFPIFRLPSQVLLVLSMQAPVLFVSAMYDIGVAGQFGLAMTSLSLPVSILSKTAGQAYYGEVARIGKDDPVRIQAVTLDIVKTMFGLAILPAAVLMAAGPWLFSIAFGAEWTQAGEFARYLSVYLLMLFTCQPLIQILTVFEKNGYFLFLNIVRAVFILIAASITFLLSLDVYQFVILYALTISIYYVYLSASILRLIRQQANRFKKDNSI